MTNICDDIFEKISSYLTYGKKIKAKKCSVITKSTNKTCKKLAFKKGFCKCHYKKLIEKETLNNSIKNYVTNSHRYSNILNKIDIINDQINLIVNFIDQYGIYMVYLSIDGKKYTYFFSKFNIDYKIVTSLEFETNKKYPGYEFSFSNLEKDYYDKKKKIFLCNNLNKNFTELEMNIINDIYAVLRDKKINITRGIDPINLHMTNYISDQNGFFSSEINNNQNNINIGFIFPKIYSKTICKYTINNYDIYDILPNTFSSNVIIQ